MKKVTSISLSGVAFSIEEDAYEALKAYLTAIEEHFTSLADGKEILADIERGIEEKLSASLPMLNGVVTLIMVERVIVEMGRVEDIIGDGESEDTGKAATPDAKRGERRLFRDTDNAIIGGVAAGLGNYFSIDPTFVRLLFVLAAFLNGFGILVYVVLWLIVPAARTTTEKYQMRGEPVTLSNIAERVQEEVTHLRTKNISGLGRLWARISAFLNGIFRLAGVLIRFVFKVLRFIVGFGLTLGGALAIAVVTSIFTLIFFIVSPESTDPITRALISELRGSAAGFVLIIAGFVAALLPIVVAILAGVSLLTFRNRFDTRTVLALGLGWIVAFSIALSTFLVLLPSLSATADSAREAFRSEERTWREVALEGAPEDVLVRGHVSLHLIEDEEVSLRIFASDETFKEVHVSQSGRSLEVDRDVHFRLCFFCGVYAPYVVELRAPNVGELAVRGDGDVLLEGIQNDTLDVSISGAFDFVGENIAVSEFTLVSRGANNIVLLGTAVNTEFNLGGASDIFASSLETDDVFLDVYGAHTIRLRPLKVLRGELGGANTVRYIENEELEVNVELSPESANSVESLGSPESIEHDSLIERVRTTFEGAREE